MGICDKEVDEIRKVGFNRLEEDLVAVVQGLEPYRRMLGQIHNKKKVESLFPY